MRAEDPFETAGNALSLCTSALDALSQCMASSAQMEDVQEVQLAMFESQLLLVIYLDCCSIC